VPRTLFAALIAAAIATVGTTAVVALSQRASVSDLEYVIAKAGDSYFAIARDQGLSCSGTALWAANGRAPLDPGTIVLIPPSCVTPATTVPASAQPSTVVSAFTHITSGGTAASPLVLDGYQYLNGLRITANHVTLRNSSVARPGSSSPMLYIDGNNITINNVIVGSVGGGSEGIRIEGGDSITLRSVVVDDLSFQGASAHSDAIQIWLQRPVTNLLIEDSIFDGFVAGDPNQGTANGSQFDGRGAGGVQFGISGTIRNTSFVGGRWYSMRYYNIGGPLRLENVTHGNGYVTNDGNALVIP
jgi:hypothetical protein